MEPMFPEAESRANPALSQFSLCKRDPVEPEPIGTIVLMAFRITGYDKDCDGSLMARLEQIERDGSTTGWTPGNLGLYPSCDLVVTMEEWQEMFDGLTNSPK